MWKRSRQRWDVRAECSPGRLPATNVPWRHATLEAREHTAPGLAGHFADVSSNEIRVSDDNGAVDQSNCDFTPATRAQHEGREINQLRRAHGGTPCRLISICGNLPCSDNTNIAKCPESRRKFKEAKNSDKVTSVKVAMHGTDLFIKSYLTPTIRSVDKTPRWAFSPQPHRQSARNLLAGDAGGVLCGGRPAWVESGGNWVDVAWEGARPPVALVRRPAARRVDA